ncbi:MAG: YdcF family protein [Clostridia bacterium]|nr:YdcF family protein [Clostridia bacterium]
MRRAAKQIVVCALALILFCVLCRLTVFRGYTVNVPILTRAAAGQQTDGKPRAELDQPEVLRLGEATMHTGYISLPVQPGQAGEADIFLFSPQGEELAYLPLRVSRLGTVFDYQSGGFTGDTAVLIAVTLFWLAVSAIMLWHYFQAKGPAYYAYTTIYFAGFSLFALVTGLLMLIVTLRHLARPAEFNMYLAYSAIQNASTQYMLLTLPLMVAFAVAMAVSNIALLRHERPRPQNALGLAVSVLLLAGEALGLYLNGRNLMGAEWEIRLQDTLENVYATVFVYFECMLAGAVICGVKAARHQPAPDKDFIVILGCWFRRDGSLPPLLKGRVDRALAFWHQQKEQTGKEAILIPSGGQGRDEPMPEAEAMRRYLLSQGVPEDKIRPETQSQNTYQNMAYSRQIIESIAPGGKTAFATTNYHVFRSGLWASQAGLPAEGIGGKTRWWFWPNAFMRECASLLQKRWKQELLLLLLLVAFFGALSVVAG